MEKIVVVVMGAGNSERYIKMCLDSVKRADKLVFLDSGSSDNTIQIAKDFGCEILHREFEVDNKYWNGQQRNFYLKYIKEKYPDYWCLALDVDEIVDDIDKIKELINHTPDAIYSVKMRHLIGNFGYEDATVELHLVPNRLFKINQVVKYPEVEHPVLEPRPKIPLLGTECTTIWHLAHVPGMWDIKRRYEGHMKKSDMHTPEYLRKWYWSHLFGRYPIKEIKLIDLPKILLDEFGIDKDEFYFQGRGLEIKHSKMVIQWNKYFEPRNVLDVGCGIGPYLYYWKMLCPIAAQGLELSNWAVNHAIVSNIQQGDITDVTVTMPHHFDLVTAIDVLEHIDYDKIDKAIDNLCELTRKYILLSVPVIGDSNLEIDKTHKIKETKDWWIKQFTKHDMKLLPTPEDWAYKEQLFVFRRKLPQRI